MHIVPLRYQHRSLAIFTRSVAARAGVGRNWYREWEAGNEMPTFYNICRLAAALNVPVTKLTGFITNDELASF